MLASVTGSAEDGKGSVEVVIDSAEGIHWADTDSHSASGRNKKRTISGVVTKSNGIIFGNSVVICLGPWSGKC